MKLLLYVSNNTSRIQYISHFIFKELMGIECTITFDPEEFQQYEGAKINYSSRSFTGQFFTISRVNLLYESNIQLQEIDCYKSENYTAFFCVNNYESIFLLAIDNELSDQERNMLDDFLKNNTDLQNEFLLLQNSIVLPDEIIFKGKMNLLKPELISLEFEQKVLLFIDDELDEEEANHLRFELASDEKLSNAINAFQQTKLTPEPEIIFANKQLLYRKEATKAIPLGWLKYAAAAVFIGFGIWGALKYLSLSSNVSIKQLSEKTSAPTNSNNGNEAGTITQIVPASKVPVTKNFKEQQVAYDLKKANNKTAGTVQKQPNLRVYDNLAVDDKNNKTSNNLPEIQNENSVEISSLDKEIAITTINEYANSEKIKSTDPQNIVYATSFSGNNEGNKVDHYSFTEVEDEPKKSRLSGFLRKAKRILERNTNMKASNENLKVASFEFATQ